MSRPYGHGGHKFLHRLILQQALLLDSRLRTQALTMSRAVIYIHGDQADFASNAGVWLCFVLFNLICFLVLGDPQLIKKIPSYEAIEKKMFNNDTTANTQKICYKPRISVIVCDNAEVWGSNTKTPKKCQKIKPVPRANFCFKKKSLILCEFAQAGPRRRFHDTHFFALCKIIVLSRA